MRFLSLSGLWIEHLFSYKIALKTKCFINFAAANQKNSTLAKGAGSCL